MTHTSASRRFRSAVAAAVLFAAAVFPTLAGSQVARRLYSLPSSSDPRVSLPDTVSPRVRSAAVLGHLGGETQLSTMSLVFKPTADQQTALTQLLADLQNPSSPQYHQWLTPQQFGQRFGVSDADLTIVQDWLTSQGFTVQSVAPAKNRIVFSGSAATAEAAFSTSLERFRRDGQDYFENSTEVSLPSTLAQVVGSVTGLSSFHLAPPPHPVNAVTPQYTNITSKGTFHYLVPWDFRQIYGVNTLISQGYDGTGIKIGVLGQTTVSTAQLTYFQQNTGQTVKMPTMTLVPNTGSAGQLSTSDEGESELDLEYASGTAPGATILFIYTGLSSSNSGVFDSLAYAISQNLAPILTLSYGGCESTNANYAMSYFEPILAQAAAQGQTILASTGDNGAAACESAKNTSTTAAAGISVAYPASSPNVTAVGGTQLNSDASTYWNSTNNSYGGSAVGYMPETTWNDTVLQGSLSATGGGASTLFGKPSWQTGTGVPADNKRDIPDIAFPAAVQEHPYIVCTVEYPCTSGSSFTGAGLYGGTSASAPNFAALLAVVQQANGSKAMGNINPTLYSLASGSSASSIFHDITTGNNIVNCQGGTLGCSSTNASTTGTMGYSAGVGYDQVTGLGSLDANGLLAGLKASSSSGTKGTPTVGLSASSMTPSGGSTVNFTITVSGSGAAPTGSVNVSTDGTSFGTPLTLTSAGAYFTGSYTVPACTGTTPCTHTVIATYSGDTNYTTGTATLVLTVPAAGSGSTGSISLSPANQTVTVTAGSTGTDAINITSTGFAGTVAFSAAAPSTLTGCYSLPSTTIASNGTASSTLTIYTSTANCSSTNKVSSSPFVAATHPTDSGTAPWQRGSLAVFAAGLIGTFFLRRRIRPTALLAVLVSVGTLGLFGCGGGGSSTLPGNGSTNASKGTYTLTISATGTPTTGTTTVTATTTVTLVVQ